MMRSLFAVALLFLLAGCERQPAVAPLPAKQVPASDDSVVDANGRRANADKPQAAPAGDEMAAGDAGQQLAHGRVHGQPFIVEEVRWKEGILEFRQGQDFLADRKFTVFLFVQDKGILPEEKTIIVKPDSNSFDTPHVHMSWKEEGSGQLQSEVFTKDYSLRLKFGTESERGKLPLTISLKLPDDQESSLDGEFVAEVKGFRVIDGKVDLTSDSFETLKHVAQTHLQAAHNAKPVEIVEARDGRFTYPRDDSRQWGWYDIKFRVDGGPSQRAKIIFVKSREGWSVHKSLKPNHFFAAHPVDAPDQESSPRDTISYLVARHVEAQLAAGDETQVVHGAHISARHNPRHGFGKGTLRYHVADEEEPRQVSFVLRKVQGRWEIVREIDPAAKVNLATGEVEDD